MPLKDALKSIKAKLGSNTPSGSETHGTASPAGSSSHTPAGSGNASPRVSGQHDRVDSRRSSLAKENSNPNSRRDSKTKSPGPVDSLMTKAKSLKSSAPGGSLANPTSSSNNNSKHPTSNGLSRNATKVRRRKARKEQRKKEVAERMEREGLGGKKGRMARRAEAGSKYRNETFGFYPLMRSDPKQTEKFEYKDMASLTEDDIGKEVTLRARIDHVRPQSSKLAFIVLRYQMERMSAVISLDESERGHTSHSNGNYNNNGATANWVGTQPTGGSRLFEEDQVVLMQQSQSAGMVEEETFHTPQEESFGGQVGQAHGEAAGEVGLAPPLPVAGLVPAVQAVPAPVVAVPQQEQVEITSSVPVYPTPTVGGQDYAGEHAGQRKDLGETGVAQRDSRRKASRHPDELASVDSDDSSSGDEEDSTDYDTEYDHDHKAGVVTEEFIRWLEHLQKESLVHITGTLQKPNNSTGEIKEASPHLRKMELKVSKCFVVGRVFEHAPFQFNEIEGHHVANEEERKTGAHLEREEEESGPGKISVRQELTNRTFDLRAPTNQAIFRIRASVCKIFRDHLDDRGFVEIQTAKLQGSATEGGASVFKLDYFGRPAYLAQSPQLAKQQAIIADMGRVYEIGSIFRAENSHDKRHMTEFVGLDLEMAIDTDYHECMHVIDTLLKAIFKGVQERNRKELEVVKQRFPHTDLVIPDETVILHYKDGVQLLRDSGHKHEDGSELADDEDFDTPTEKRLGALVKEKYNTDYYILDKFPTAVRPFYTMPDPTDPRYSNSFDIFVRGQEILSGGQRIHDSTMLEGRMKESGMDPEVLGEYTHAFRLGAPPHAGGGVGLDRLIMLMLQLGNIRFASMYPRDPKSFPDSGKPPPMPRPKIGRHGTLPTLEDLIAAFGDSTNTSWVDPRYTIWRHLETGAALGYVQAKHNYGVIWGPPLCAPEDTEDVIQAWLEHCDEIKLKPIWCCVDEHTAEILAKRYRWKAVSCIAETRVDPKHYNGAPDSNVTKKIQGAKKSGVKVTELEEAPGDDLKNELDHQIAEWSSHREGTQMHISDISGDALLRDAGHKRFFVAKDEHNKLVGIVVLARLSPQHGEQIKWSLQFPDAPNGTSEYMLSEAMKSASESGVASLTFGASAAEKIVPMKDQKSLSIKVLAKAYDGIKSAGNLGNKTNYRHKWGTTDEPLYVAYPKHGLGTRGIQAIMETITDEHEKKTDHAHDQRNQKRVDESEV